MFNTLVSSPVLRVKQVSGPLPIRLQTLVITEVSNLIGPLLARPSTRSASRCFTTSLTRILALSPLRSFASSLFRPSLASQLETDGVTNVRGYRYRPTLLNLSLWVYELWAL